MENTIEILNGVEKTVQLKKVKDSFNYLVSEYGQLYSYRKNKLKKLKSYVKSNGYKYAILIDGSKYRKDIHRIVAEVFIPPEREYKYINHLDGDLNNNHYSNLKWNDEPEEICENHGIWKVIPEFPNYKISIEGKIKSYHGRLPKIMKTYVSGDGYEKVVLNNGKSVDSNVHRLVAITYLKNSNNYKYVNHIDYDKLNNNLDNLKWSQHINRKITTTGRCILQYDLEGKFIQKYKNAVEAAKNFNVGAEALRKCANGGSKTSAGFIWKFGDEKEKRSIYILKDGEIGKPIIGNFDDKNFNYPDFTITNFGNVINKNGIKMNHCLSNGYLAVGIKGRVIRIHVLVGLFFIEGRTKEKCIINHIDENKHNPHWENLEWVSYSENMKHSKHINEISVNMLDKATSSFIRRFDSITEAATFLNKSQSKGDISSCCIGLLQSAMGHKWEYA